MIYNIDFLIASLVFLLVILYHFMEQRFLNLENNQSFLWLILAGILDIFFDLLCTLLITLAKPELANLTAICLMILYMLQVLVPHALLCHIQSRLEPAGHGMKCRFILCYVLPVIMGVLVFFNYWTHIFFTVSPTGAYYRGPLYPLMYIFAGLYLIASAMFCVIHAAYLEKSERKAVWELVFFTGATVVIQSIYHDILLTGFGITMGITVLFFTINNPYQYTDSLTSAFDIRYFRTLCRSMIEHHKKFHILSVELSQLKRINLIFGADLGSQLLTDTAKMLQNHDKRNIVFRVSGRRFLIITQTIFQYDSLRKEVQEFFSKPVSLKKEFVFSPVTICGILNAEQLKTSNTILSYIGYLTSLTPNSSQTCVIQGDEETLKGYRYNQKIESFLDVAVQEDLFEIVFQPVYSCSRHGFISLEALSRLRHPTLGPVSPDVFITIAEKNDQIACIGMLQLRRVCRFLQKHPEIMSSIQSVKINLSPAELMKTGHADSLIRTIEEHGLPPAFFQFEITETVATDYSTVLNEIASKFTKAGIGLCLDDFGSGFANLNTVMKLPFQIIKLDRSLLFGICKDKRIANLYKSLVSSLHVMGFRVISEGVETQQELDSVVEWGVDMIQGYYFSRPLPGDELLRLLSSEKEKDSFSLS